MTRLSLAQVAETSFFVRRSLASMHFGADESERLAHLKAYADRVWTAEDIERRLAAIDDSDGLSYEMRRLRREVLVGLIARDVTGAGGLDEVIEVMTALAESTVHHTLRVHARELALRHGVPIGTNGEPQDMLVIGMGKLGGSELNVSSDIDLIFLYDEAGQTQAVGEFASARRPISNHEFFEKLAKRVIPALNDLDGTGFVFRVDMRLRPFGDAGPIVVSTAMLEEYLYTQGRDWERFAWLKARVVNRPVFMRQSAFDDALKLLDSLVRPFVFRKYADFSAISALSRVHEMIRTQTLRRQIGKEDEINVKLGRGGIREIEFITQTFQIIRGGREPELRDRRTRPMLRLLAERGVMDREVAERLIREYEFLRNLEHALQYVDDKQTQTLPADPESRERVAAMLGIESSAMMRRLHDAQSFVAGVFDSIFNTDVPSEESPGWQIGWDVADEEGRKACQSRLTELGFADAQGLSMRIDRLLNSRIKAIRNADLKRQFKKFVIRIAEHANEWAQLKTSSVPGDEVFHRYLNLLDVIAGRPTYVALLNQYPGVGARVGRLLAMSRWAADYLTAHPLLLDEMIDDRAALYDDFSPVDWCDWSENLRRQLMACEDDQERQMNLLRDAHHGAVFRLLLSDLDGRFTVERLADQLSALADAAIELVIDLAWRTIPTRHVERPKFAVVAYGKLGGKELGYASDLDIVFLYDDPDQEGVANYPKLVRRMLSWLTVQTSSGILFQVDMRLRPNGENGLIASSFEMFKRYQHNEDGNGAWEWEHQALTRARFCAGDPDIGRAFETERRAILLQPRDPAKVAKGVVEMRQKMLDGHPNNSDLFDVKHDRGGMVDIEFVVQMLVLAYAHRHPELTNNFGNILLLEMAGRCGLIDPELAKKSMKAYRHYRKMQREIRLSQGENAPARVPRQAAAVDRAVVLELWQAVFGQYA